MLPAGNQGKVSQQHPPKKPFSGAHHGKPPQRACSGHILPAATKHICTSPRLRFSSAPTLPHKGAFGWVCINSGRVLLGHHLPLRQASEVWGTKAALLPAEGTQCPSLVWFYSFWNKLFALPMDQPLPVPSLNWHLPAKPRSTFGKGLHREVVKKGGHCLKCFVGGIQWGRQRACCHFRNSKWRRRNRSRVPAITMGRMPKPPALTQFQNTGRVLRATGSLSQRKPMMKPGWSLNCPNPCSHRTLHSLTSVASDLQSETTLMSFLMSFKRVAVASCHSNL